MTKRNRDDALCGAGLVLSTQMDGGVTTIYEFLIYFFDKIRYYKLSPWGKKGREYLIGGVEELISCGGYEALTTCESCKKEFLMKLNITIVDLFLKTMKGETDVTNWIKCNECGGAVEL